MVIRRFSASPEVIFCSPNSFKIQDIGIGSFNSSGYRTTVEDSHHLTFSKPLGKIISPIHGYLVISFKEIDLRSCHSPGLHFTDPITW
jgi:hypothetical protein